MSKKNICVFLHSTSPLRAVSGSTPDPAQEKQKKSVDYTVYSSENEAISQLHLLVGNIDNLIKCYFNFPWNSPVAVTHTLISIIMQFSGPISPRSSFLDFFSRYSPPRKTSTTTSIYRWLFSGWCDQCNYVILYIYMYPATYTHIYMLYMQTQLYRS